MSRATWRTGGWTLLELAVVAGVLAFLGLVLAPGLARTNPAAAKGAQCARNLYTLTSAWRMYADENADVLVASGSGLVGRPVWVTFGVESNPFALLKSSPLWTHVGQNLSTFRCPADAAKVLISGTAFPSPRSYSMSHVFGNGAWLDKSFNPNQTVWRTYARAAEVVIPARTFVFLDEHPDSINDGSFANACTGAQPTDPPSSAWIIDFPANYHNGGCNLSFADGHVETHAWTGAKIRNAPINYTGNLLLNVPAESSYLDIRWLASRTTVRR
ncbi:MAG TPA: prepilin-type N-terminal cleavage/methylation domain-containing protein [Verrucomicrobiae bacterium]